MIRHPRLTLVALGLTSSLALTGCGNLISQQAAAATVGDQRVTTTELQDLVDRSLASPEAKQTVGADPVAFERTALRRIISHLLIVEAAKREGVTIDNAAVDNVFDKFAQQTGGVDALNAAATKAGIALLTQQMAIEWGPHGIRVNAIAPGLILAGMSDPIYADLDIRAARESKVPLGRLGTADDIASLVVFLASTESSYITGQNILVDGGVTMSMLANLPRPKSVDKVGKA